MALVRAELLKMRGRMAFGLLLASLALSVLTAIVDVPTADAHGGLSLDDPSELARVVGLSVSIPEVLMMLLGVLAVTQEFRYGTASSTYLVEPRRGRVLLAKWIGITLASLPVTAISIVAALAATVTVIVSRDGNLTMGSQLAQVIAASFLVLAMFGLMGVAIGALIRNQVTAVVVVLVWMLAVEQVLISAYPVVGRWMLAGASLGVLQAGELATTKGAMLAAPVAGLVLAGYTLLAVVLAWVLTPRRDVL